MKTSVLVLLVGILANFLVGNALAYTITLNGYGTSVFQAEAEDQSGPFAFDQALPGSLPYSYASNVSDGLVSNDTTYLLTNSSFDITFEHDRPSTEGAYARSTSLLYFAVDQNVSFLASGNYSAVDSSGRRTWFEAALYDLTTSTQVLNSNQQSLATPNESFTLGGLGGDSVNSFVGALTGTLIAGHDYRFSYFVAVQAIPATTSGATASGNLNLSFTAVPEPGTGLLLGIATTALAAVRRRK